MELQPVIFAGGRGSHMTDLTNHLPKPLLPVGNKPLIFYPINMLEKAGFQEVIIITLKSIQTEIEQILKGFQIASIVRGIDDDSDCDTLDSLREIKDDIKTDILVISCDFISDISLRKLVDVHKLHDSSVTMLLATASPQLDITPGVKTKKKGQRQPKDFIGLCPVDALTHRMMFLFNEADFEDDTLSLRMNLLREFPRVQVRTDLRDAHVYIMRKWILEYIFRNESKTSLRSELLPYLVHKQFSSDSGQTRKNGDKLMEDENDTSPHDPTQPKAQTTRQDIFTFLDKDEFICGGREFISDLSLSKKSTSSRQLLCQAHIYEEGFLINANRIASYIEANRMVAKSESIFCDETSRISPTTTVHEKSQIGSDCIVGERTEIAEKTSVKRSVIGVDCRIGVDVRISNCIIMDHATIEDGCVIQGSIVCENAKIGEKSDIKDCLIGFKKEIANSSTLSRESVVDDGVMEFD